MSINSAFLLIYTPHACLVVVRTLTARQEVSGSNPIYSMDICSVSDSTLLTHSGEVIVFL